MKTAKEMSITALAGGVGASKLLLGFYDVADPARLTAIVNTGDDITLHGLKISPDLDIALRCSQKANRLATPLSLFVLRSV
jgi:2-phospho-L-lactate transferase/gluconeogenesis factor (CofD/UPF0052 family)